MHSSQSQPQFRKVFLGWWRERVREIGAIGSTAVLLRELWGFLRESTPERRRQRYGDMEYDWEHRVNTTSGTVGWRERLFGVFLSPYQPTDPALFAEMMASLRIDFRQFTFVDLGSGKGRTLLMAAEYPFHRIVGVEILTELHRIAEENVRKYVERSAETRVGSPQHQGERVKQTRQAASLQQSSGRVECVCADARNYEFPAEPLVIYLFNPVSEAGLLQVMANLESSVREHPRDVYIAYHNPLLEHVLAKSAAFTKIGGTHQFTIFANLE